MVRIGRDRFPEGNNAKLDARKYEGTLAQTGEMALASQLYMKKRRDPETGQPQNLTFRQLLSLLDLAISDCESALRSSSLRLIGRRLKLAKKSYGTALRSISYHSLTVEEVQALDTKSILLEAAIARLEARFDAEDKSTGRLG